MGKTSIEWTDASWNPIVGCTEISPGCANCYAARLAATRLKNTPQYKGLAVLRSHPDAQSECEHDPLRVSMNHPRWTGEVRNVFELHPKVLEEPLRWRAPRRIFVCDMGDLFHETCAVDWVERVFAIMAAARRHTFQVLTKRPSIARTLLSSATFQKHVFEKQMDGDMRQLGKNQKRQNFVTSDWPLPNVWLGTSVENQHFADERIPLLLATPAAVRWISAEPLLGPVDLHGPFESSNVLSRPCTCALHDHFADYEKHAANCGVRRWIDWVVAGGESGANARPMHPDWARSLRDQCLATGVPFFFKQWGEWAHVGSQGILSNVRCREVRGEFWRVGKKAAGRLLDGREWNEFPK